jgi:hypothetical protein
MFGAFGVFVAIFAETYRFLYAVPFITLSLSYNQSQIALIMKTPPRNRTRPVQRTPNATLARLNLLLRRLKNQDSITLSIDKHS